ncbi:MAG: S8 family serine peptidase [Parcubacteria group bacterium]|nr:S8 family serine peptidase [Parcubacteria group bacterium]
MKSKYSAVALLLSFILINFPCRSLAQEIKTKTEALEQTQISNQILVVLKTDIATAAINGVKINGKTFEHLTNIAIVSPEEERRLSEIGLIKSKISADYSDFRLVQNPVPKDIDSFSLKLNKGQNLILKFHPVGNFFANFCSMQVQDGNKNILYHFASVDIDFMKFNLEADKDYTITLRPSFPMINFKYELTVGGGCNAFTNISENEPNNIDSPQPISNETKILGKFFPDNIPEPLSGAPRDPFSGYQTNLKIINAPQAWQKNNSGNGIVVATMDTGVEINHPDLKDHLYKFEGEIPDNGVDDDQDGGIDNVYGYDASSFPKIGVGNAVDGFGHGTHVDGIGMAVAHNNEGISGLVQKNVKVVPVRIFNDLGLSDITRITSGYDWIVGAKKRGIPIKIVNHSWGGYGDQVSEILKELTRHLEEVDIISVCAAGNDKFNIDVNRFYPAALSKDLESVFAVAAIDSDTGALASFSNYGKETVLLGAPGVNIPSTLPGESYGVFSGTSMASPHVRGALVLWLALHPNASFSQVKNALSQSVISHRTLADKTITGGYIDINKLLSISPQ